MGGKTETNPNTILNLGSEQWASAGLKGALWRWASLLWVMDLQQDNNKKQLNKQRWRALTVLCRMKPVFLPLQPRIYHRHHFKHHDAHDRVVARPTVKLFIWVCTYPSVLLLFCSPHFMKRELEEDLQWQTHSVRFSNMFGWQNKSSILDEMDGRKRNIFTSFQWIWDTLSPDDSRSSLACKHWDKKVLIFIIRRSLFAQEAPSGFHAK